MTLKLFLFDLIGIICNILNVKADLITTRSRWRIYSILLTNENSWWWFFGCFSDQKISNFDEIFHLLGNFKYSEIKILVANFYFLRKFIFFYQNFDEISPLLGKFKYFTKMSIFAKKKCDFFWRKFQFVSYKFPYFNNILIFWRRRRFLTKIRLLVKKWVKVIWQKKIDF